MRGAEKKRRREVHRRGEEGCGRGGAFVLSKLTRPTKKKVGSLAKRVEMLLDRKGIMLPM